MWNTMRRALGLSLVLAAATLSVNAYSIGDQGVQVLKIQKQLSQYGYRIKADGVYGGETARAVQLFQADKGLAIDGIVDNKTYRKLTGSSLSRDEAKRAEQAKKAAATLKTKYPSRNYGEYSKARNITSHDVIGDRLVSTANRYVGVPYVFGGNDPSGFDCSGFTRYVYSAVGIDLPRMADEQYNVGSYVSRSFLQPGDLVFFTTYLPGVSHVGIYIGNNQFINASNNGVSIDNLDSRYWSSRYVGARRVM